MSTKVKRTYASKRGALPPSPPHSSPSKRLFEELGPSPENSPKRARLISSGSPRFKFKSNPDFGTPKPKASKKQTSSRSLAQNTKKPGTIFKQKSLTQLHFCVDKSILRTCSLCDFSYIKGAAEDESLHRAHCARVQRGMEWGKEEEREKAKAGFAEISTNVRLKNGSKGRIISVKADATGKIGSKLTVLLQTINLALSSPPLTLEILRASKAYIFLLAPPSSSAHAREKIVGCVIAQRIETAMAIASTEDCITASEQEQQASEELFLLTSTSTPISSQSSSGALSPPTGTLVAVDTSANLFCHPKPLPTPLGIPRLFVSAAHRRHGIAQLLLQAAADTFVHGCKLDPKKGQVAFTQPTNSGASVMRAWGGGNVRIYEE